jgi:hypothetical protein
MDQLRVPTIALPATVRYFDERPLTGRIFLPVCAQHHDGPMRVDEWINQSSVFFPFVQDGTEHATILNKRYVVILTIDTPDDHAVDTGVLRRVTVECGTVRVEGLVHIDMPEHHSRLLDWANRAEPFLVVTDNDRRHIIQKTRITFLREVD